MLNENEAWWVALNHIDPELDGAVLDGPSTCWTIRACIHKGPKMGIDATLQMPEAGFNAQLADPIEMDPVRSSVWMRCVDARVGSDARRADLRGKRFLRHVNLCASAHDFRAAIRVVGEAREYGRRSR